jgi:hypothetical protein
VDRILRLDGVRKRHRDDAETGRHGAELVGEVVQ